MPGVKKNLANKAFITDASQRKAIPIIRSLGNHNIKVIAGESNSWSMGFFSKYCSERFIYPSPTKNSTLFVEWLRDFLRYNHCDVLLPIDSKTMDIITEHLDELSKYTAIPVVNHSVYMKARDKEQTIRIALENNIPCPTTYFLSKIEEIDLIAEKITFPIVIKPRQSEGSRGIAYAWSKNNLYSQYYKIHRYYPLPLIQEYIPAGGSTIGVELLFNKNSEPRAIFAHKRIREYPVSGGPSTLSESVYAPRAVEMGIKLLKALGWYGVAMIEFKIDPRDNTPKLMEINPKFWGSIQLPIICGVDFPYLLYRMATEGDVAPVFDYKVGVRCRWLIPGDILHFLNNPNRFRLKPNFFKFMDKNLYYDILSINDPGPFLGMCIGFLLKIFNKETWRDLCR
jgi:predicted ATP-grasp superfamily ATP-dependent carboligase